jgi:hypothetical protein
MAMCQLWQMPNVVDQTNSIIFISIVTLSQFEMSQLIWINGFCQYFIDFNYINVKE